MDNIVDQFFNFLEQVILPNWPDLIALLPWVLIVVIFFGFVYLAWQWRRAGARNRSRVPRPVSGRVPAGVHMPGPSKWPFLAPIGGVMILFAIVLPDNDPFNFWLFVVGLIWTIVTMVGWMREATREWRAAAAQELAAEQAALGPGAGVNASVAVVPAHAGALQQTGQAEPAEPREPPPGIHMPGPSPWPFFAPISMAIMLYGLIFSSVLIVGGLILAIISMAGWYLEAGREWRTTDEFGHAIPETRDPVRAWPRRLVPVYLGTIVICFGVALAPLFLGWLNSMTPAAATPTPINVPAVPKISAQNIAFDTRTLIVPANRDFDLVFDNNDAGVPHNVQIDSSPARETTLFDGEVVDGIVSITYHVPALAPGEYYFLCKIHPNMNGVVEAIQEPGGPGGAPQPSAP